MEKMLKMYVFKLFYASEFCRFCGNRQKNLRLVFPIKKQRSEANNGSLRIPHPDAPKKNDRPVQITIIVRDESTVPQ